MKNIMNVILGPQLFIFLGIGLIFWYFSTGGGPYSKYTGRTMATILSCYQTHMGSGEEDQDEYEAALEYEAEGKVWNCPRFISNSWLTPGEQVELAYLPGDPEKITTAYNMEHSWFMVVSGVCMILIGFFVWRNVKKT